MLDIVTKGQQFSWFGPFFNQIQFQWQIYEQQQTGGRPELSNFLKASQSGHTVSPLFQRYLIEPTDWKLCLSLLDCHWHQQIGRCFEWLSATISIKEFLFEDLFFFRLSIALTLRD